MRSVASGIRSLEAVIRLKHDAHELELLSVAFIVAKQQFRVTRQRAKDL